ncbi:MAG: DNA repair protein RecN [Bdellovibrionales bacterium]|nr:DNA repair protein RecN [Bdellovibrionales bacterium]
MLSVLRVSNFALIDHAEVEFDSGLNIVTGETGTGKSILLRALGLLQGGRASSDFISRGAESAEIEGLFILDDLDQREISLIYDELEGEELLIRRTIDSGGKSKVYINGRMATVSMLSQIGERLLAITSQHDQRLLVDMSQQREMLDSYGVPKKLLQEVADKFEKFNDARKRYRSFVEKSEEQALRLERIKAEYDELRAAGLEPGEREELEGELSRLANVETLGSAVQEAMDTISGEDESIHDRLAHLQNSVAKAVRLDPKLGPIAELLDSAAVTLDEASIALADYSSALDADPERLEILRSRIAEIARLERKYKRDLAGLITYRDAVGEEVSLYESGAFDLERLESDMKAAQSSLAETEAKLTKSRKALAAKMQDAITGELAKLNMKDAVFEVSVSPAESGAHGADRIEFLLSANPGEPVRPLSKAASGGELSRILLVLKTALSERSGASLQVFDEIDTGVGGRVAHVVGEKLSRVSEFSQVLVVTHAPQVAAFADRHFVVNKSSSRGRAQTELLVLDDNQRVGELARMLAGKKVTPEFEDSARELLAAGRRKAA